VEAQLLRTDIEKLIVDIAPFSPRFGKTGLVRRCKEVIAYNSRLKVARVNWGVMFAIGKEPCFAQVEEVLALRGKHLRFISILTSLCPRDLKEQGCGSCPHTVTKAQRRDELGEYSNNCVMYSMRQAFGSCFAKHLVVVEQAAEMSESWLEENDN